MPKNMFSILDFEEDEPQEPQQQEQDQSQSHSQKSQTPPYTLQDMVNEHREIERKMTLGMSWYDIFMREDEEKRWREEAKFGKPDDWTDITKKNKAAPKPKRSRLNCHR